MCFNLQMVEFFVISKRYRNRNIGKRKIGSRIDIIETINQSSLSFIILVKNAFKYGVESSEGRCFLHIDLETTGSQLVLRCMNSFEAVANTNKGIGLENLKQRLKLRFPNQQKLIVKASEGILEVELT